MLASALMEVFLAEQTSNDENQETLAASTCSKRRNAWKQVSPASVFLPVVCGNPAPGPVRYKLSPALLSIVLFQ
jgi:hypothetical protein